MRGTISRRFVSGSERLCTGVGSGELHNVSDFTEYVFNVTERIFYGQGWAPDWLRDQYSEHSIGITWWPDKLITIRPSFGMTTLR